MCFSNNVPVFFIDSYFPGVGFGPEFERGAGLGSLREQFSQQVCSQWLSSAPHKLYLPPTSRSQGFVTDSRGKRIHPFLLLPLWCSKGRNHWECPLDRSAVHHRTNTNPQTHSSGYIDSPIIPVFMFLISGRKLANTLGEASIEDDHTVRYSHYLLPVHITFG